MDPNAYERRARVQRRLTVVAALLFYACALTSARLVYGPLVGFVVTTPVLAGYAAWLLVYRGESALWLLRWLALRKIDGRRYFFDCHPVRIEERAGRSWVAARELFAALDEPIEPQTLRRLHLRFGAARFHETQADDWWFEETAVLEWLWQRAARPDRVAQRLHWWLEREILPALRRQRGG